MADNYVFLKNLGGEVINPRTELGAIDMTTVNGIVVSANTIGIMDGYIESSYYMNMVSGTDAANQDSAYIDGGTMFQLIGGYTVTDEIPPITGASHERVPSEYSVRSAIDALATLGPSLAPGAGIVVETVPGSTGGTIAVAPGDGINVNTAQTGGVSVKAATSGGLSVTSAGVAVNAGAGLAIDGSENVNVVAKAGGGLAVDTTGVGIVAGDTLDLTGGTVNAKVAAVDEVLTSLVTGSTVQDDVEEVTPGNLRGALSVGQAVDVSCEGKSSTRATIVYDTTYLDMFKLVGTTQTANVACYFGFSWGRFAYRFPKRAANLKYLCICDIRNHGNALGYVVSDRAIKINLGTPIPGVASSCSGNAGNDDTPWTRIAGTFVVGSDGDSGAEFELIYSTPLTVGDTFEIEIKNWRQYEVTALTDEAIAYIAQLPDPDAFFRSASVYSLRDKYLIKQDMVCPFIPTISMPDNSDLTVGAGLSYKIKYTNDNPHTITADTIPTDAYGWDTHIQMFIKGTSSIVFQKPLILMDALTPNAGHNLVVKFRNGDAYVYVDDTNAGYIVTVASGTETGSLYDGISNDYTDYVIFAAELDGTTVDAGDATFSGGTGISAVNVLGNGTDNTTITGNISATSGNTINFQSMTIDGGTLGGAGTMNLDGVGLSNIDFSCNSKITNSTILSGSTVSRTILKVFDASNSALIVDGELYTGYSTSVNLVGSTISGTGIIKVQGQLRYNDAELTSYVSGVSIEVTEDNYMPQGSGQGYIYCGRGTLYLTNMRIYAKKNIQATVYATTNSVYNGTIYIDGCTITEHTGNEDIRTAYGGIIHISNSTVGRVRNDKNSPSYTPYVYLSNSINILEGLYGSGVLNIASDSILTLASSARIEGAITIGNNVSISIGDTISNIDACIFVSNINPKDTKIEIIGETNKSITITGSTANPWKATNVIFASPLDAMQADTIKLTGTTVTTTAKTLNANRIQLPASTTVSFSGNTNSADTKILDAGLIVVGDNPASPSGTATVVNASGASSTVTGIGTYIDKEGDNDFEPITNINKVTTDAASGTGSLNDALIADKKFIQLNESIIGNVGATQVDVVNKNLITHDYEPIIGGTFSLTSATVDEATKTTTILSGGTMSVVDIRGGKDSVIDLGGTRITLDTGALIANNVAFANGSAAAGGAIFAKATAESITLSGCTISNNNATSRGGGIYTAAPTSMTSCVITGNNAAIGGAGGAALMTLNTSVTLRDTIISGNIGGTPRDLYVSNGAAYLDGGCKLGDTRTNGGVMCFGGSNSIKTLTGNGSAIISSGATLDLTGNTNATPVAPDGAIVFEQGGATVLYGTTESPSSCFIGGATFTGYLDNNGGVGVSSGSFLFYGADVVMSGVTVNTTGYFYPEQSMQNVRLVNAVNNGTGLMLGWNPTITIAGTYKGSYIYNANYATIDYGTVILEDGTILDVTPHATRGVIYHARQITIGSGCKLKINGGSPIDLTSGTYTSATLNSDGTITEA